MSAIFLSYASQDAEAAKRIFAQIQQCPWLPEPWQRGIPENRCFASTPQTFASARASVTSAAISGASCGVISVEAERTKAAIVPRSRTDCVITSTLSTRCLRPPAARSCGATMMQQFSLQARKHNVVGR